MNIVQIVPDFPPFSNGGGAITAFRLHVEFKKLGYGSSIITSYCHNNLSDEIHANDDFTYSKINAICRCNILIEYFIPLSFIGAANKKKEIKNKLKVADIVIIHGLLDSISRYSLSKLHDRKNVILTYHGTPTAEYSIYLSFISKLLHRVYGKINSNHISKFVTFSDQSTQDLMQILPRGSHYINVFKLGIDKEKFISDYNSAKNSETFLEQKFQSIIKDRKFCFSIGRIAPNKGFLELIKAFSSYQNVMKNTVLIIAGSDSGFLNNLREEIGRLKLDKEIFLIGRVSEIEKIFLMIRSACFIIPSLREGFGINALEAAILGVKTVATDTGRHKEILASSEGKYKIIEKIEKSEFHAVKELVDDPLPNRWRINDLLISHYSITRLAQMYTELYD